MEGVGEEEAVYSGEIRDFYYREGGGGGVRMWGG